MRLFDQFVIREQEVFACRVVNYLLQRSPELREGLIEAINDEVRDLWLLNKSHFSCTPEQPVDGTAPEDARGRIDVFIEIDNAVVGIEAKLNAPIGRDQPGKYLHTLKAVAEKLAQLRGTEIATVFVLLIPKGRQNEGKTALGLQLQADRVRTCVLTWECLFEAWRAAKVTDDVALFVLDELEHLVLTQTGRRRDFQRLLPLVRQPLDQSTHDAHHEFVGWLYPAFRSNRPDLGTRLQVARKRGDRTYLGYYFALGQIDEVWGWYGFVDPKFAGNLPGSQPALVMGTDFDVPDLDHEVFERISFSHPGFNKDAKWWWRIRFERSWDNLSRWQAALRPVRQAVEAAGS